LNVVVEWLVITYPSLLVMQHWCEESAAQISLKKISKPCLLANVAAPVDGATVAKDKMMPRSQGQRQHSSI
jgi:hypothetical protein